MSTISPDTADRFVHPVATGDDGANESSIVQIMTTEHFTLQMARGVANAESASRFTLFLTVVSAVLVGLALAAQVVDGEGVAQIALLALILVFFLGLVTYLRVLDNGIEDYLYVKEMNRIRHFYLETAPSVATYLVLSHHDDPPGIHQSMGMHVRRWEMLLTSSGAVALVDAVVAGIFGALTLHLFTGSNVVSAVMGVTMAGIVGVLFMRHSASCWLRAENEAPARFPH